jgi:molybdopterin converting factor small subunit
MKISIILEGYLKYKYFSNILELNYSKPVTIYKILEDTKLSSADVFFIKVGDKIVKEDYLLTESTEVKLFPIIGGG